MSLLFSAWTTYVSIQGSQWYTFYKQWLTQKEIKLHIVQFFNLQHNLREEVLEMGRFLGVKDEALNNKAHIDCIINNSGEALRRPTMSFPMSPFSASMNISIDLYKNTIKDMALRNHNVHLTY